MPTEVLSPALRRRITAGRDGCWHWTGTVDLAGYGRFNGRYAHRRAWAHVNGPIAPGLVVHHLCGMRDCVRPSHLDLQARGPHIAAHRASERAMRPLVTPEQRRERARLYMRMWLARQRLQGGCRLCIAPVAVVAGVPRTACAVHLAAERAYKHRRSAAAR